MAADADPSPAARSARRPRRERTPRPVLAFSPVRHVDARRRVPLEITVSRPGADPERRAIDAALSVGGSRADGLVVPGLAAAALRLRPAAAGLVVETSASGLRVGGHSVAPGACRLLREGEQAEIRGVTIALRRAAPAPDAGARCAVSQRSDARSRWS